MSIYQMSRAPSHPGDVFFNLFFPKMNITQSKLYELLHVSEQTVIDIKKKRRGLTPLMALKLAKITNTSPDVWIGMQEKYDLWHAYQENKEEVDQVQPLEVA